MFLNNIATSYRWVIEEINPPIELIETLEYVMHLFLPLNGLGKVEEAIKRTLRLGLETPESSYTTLRLLCYIQGLNKVPEIRRSCYLKSPKSSNSLNTSCLALFDLTNQFIFTINDVALKSFWFKESEKPFIDDDYDTSKILENVLHPDRDLSSIKVINNIIAEIAQGILTNDVASVSRYRDDNKAILTAINILNNYELPGFSNNPREELAVHLSNIYNSKEKPTNKNNRTIIKSDALAIEVFIELLLEKTQTNYSRKILRTSKWKKANKNIRGRIIGEPYYDGQQGHNTSYFDNISGNIEPLPKHKSLNLHSFKNPFLEIDRSTEHNTNDKRSVGSLENTQAPPEAFLPETYPAKQKITTTQSYLKKFSPIIYRSRIYSIFDPNIVSASILLSLFNHLYIHNKLMHSYAYLCAFTGISWKRIENLLIQNTPSNIQNEQIYFSPSDSCLFFRVINGATAFSEEIDDSNITADIVKLEIPSSISEQIAIHNDSTPFFGYGNRLQNIAKHFGRNNPGNPPTPERLNYTFLRLISRNGLSNIERLMISGRISYTYRAQARYSSFDLDTLNKKYQTCITGFINGIKRHTNTAADVSLPFDFPKKTIKGKVGSLLAQPISSFAPMIMKIAACHHKTTNCAGARSIKNRIISLQLQHANYYLMLQLLAGLRPIGEASRLYLNELSSALHIKQKDSSDFLESFTIPLSKLISSQIEQCNLSLEYLFKLLRIRKYKISTPDFMEQPFPCFFKLDGKNLDIQPLFSDKFHELLDEYDITNLIPGDIKKSNIYRHSLYSEILQIIPESYLSEIFQHHRDGLELFSPWSTANIKNFMSSRRVLDQIAEKAGFSVLRCR